MPETSNLPTAMGATFAERRNARLGVTAKAVESDDSEDKAISDGAAENKAVTSEALTVKRGRGRPKKVTDG